MSRKGQRKMINNDSVVTAYDEHLTLVEWLQKVEVLLKNSGLKEVALNDKGNGSQYNKALFSLTLTFNDGTKIESNDMALKSVNEALNNLNGDINTNAQRIDDLESEVDNKTIPLFGKYSILVPEDSADTNILPLPTDASTKNYTLNSVNGTLTWNTIGNGLEIKNGALQEKVLNVSITLTAEELSQSINSPVSIAYTGTDKSTIFDFIKAQNGIMKLTINTPIGALCMTLRPSLWKDDIHHSYNFEGTLYLETDLSTIGGTSFNQIIVRAICWDNSNSVDFRPTIIPIGTN